MRALALLGLAVACGGGPAVFTSEEGRFSIMMPGRPQEFTSPPEAGDAGRRHSFAYPTPNVLYAVNYVDLLTAPGDPHAFLAAVHEGSLRRAPGDVVRNTRVELHGNPGLETEVRFPDGTVYRVRYYLADRRLYEVHVFGRPEGMFPAQFLRSFSLR